MKCETYISDIDKNRLSMAENCGLKTIDFSESGFESFKNSDLASIQSSLQMIERNLSTCFCLSSIQVEHLSCLVECRETQSWR